TKFGPVHAVLRVKHPFAKGFNDGTVSRCAGGHDLMRQSVGINGISSQMFKHFSHEAFAHADIAREANHIFICPATHGDTSRVMVGTLQVKIDCSLMPKQGQAKLELRRWLAQIIVSILRAGTSNWRGFSDFHADEIRSVIEKSLLRIKVRLKKICIV